VTTPEPKALARTLRLSSTLGTCRVFPSSPCDNPGLPIALLRLWSASLHEVDHFQPISRAETGLTVTGARHQLAVTLDGDGPRVAAQSGDQIRHRRPPGDLVRLAVQDHLEQGCRGVHSSQYIRCLRRSAAALRGSRIKLVAAPVELDPPGSRLARQIQARRYRFRLRVRRRKLGAPSSSRLPYRPRLGRQVQALPGGSKLRAARQSWSRADPARHETPQARTGWTTSASQ